MTGSENKTEVILNFILSPGVALDTPFVYSNALLNPYPLLERFADGTASGVPSGENSSVHSFYLE